jgi:Arc/MetJ family transcription regulator
MWWGRPARIRLGQYIEIGSRTIYSGYNQEVVVAKTLLDIPDELMEEARKTLGPRATKAETVRVALKEMVRRHKLEEMMARLDAGSLSDLDDPEVVRSAQR